MGMTISILGGLGLFLLGMSVMTDGLKALAGSALRRLLAAAAATPMRGTFWGMIATLLVQSSSATTMTTIGLVSAGLLTFPQGLSLVFGANIGTTGTGWLVALVGVKVSLTSAALPIVFAGALLKLLGTGRYAGAGAAIAGFGLLLVGITTLQDGMSALAQRINPADLPEVLGGGTHWVRGMIGVLQLVVVGVVMTTLMQSSSASVAATLTALHAGAIAPDQAVALVIGQNIGTAVSSAIAAIGTTTPAKRTAVAYIMFKLITAIVALLLFPVVVPLIMRATAYVDAATLLAGYHTAYNVLGVSMLLPLIQPFSRRVERIVPDRGSAFTRHLDRSVLNVPAVAVEAARRTVSSVLESVCDRVARSVRERGTPAEARETLDAATDALDRSRTFLSRIVEPPTTTTEQRRLAGTLHALDHAARLVEAVGEDGSDVPVADAPEAKDLAISVMNRAVELCRRVQAPQEDADVPAGVSLESALQQLATDSAALAELRRAHRQATLDASAAGQIDAEQAINRVEAVRRIDRLAYHAWRATSHLVDRGARPSG